jgi:hypothetical protein
LDSKESLIYNKTIDPITESSAKAAKARNMLLFHDKHSDTELVSESQFSVNSDPSVIGKTNLEVG